MTVAVDIVIPDVEATLGSGYESIKIYADVTADGNFTDLRGSVNIMPGIQGYVFYDLQGDSNTFYRTAYYGADVSESAKSEYQKSRTIDAYVSGLDVRQELAIGSGQERIGLEFSHVIWTMCIEASRMIDRYKKVRPGAYYMETRDEEVRYYDVGHMDRVNIDWLVSASKVEVRTNANTWETWVDGTHYNLWPYNAVANGEPYRQIRIDEDNTASAGSSGGVFVTGQRKLRVTGKFGCAVTPPETIQRAAKIQVARWFNRAKQGWQNSSETINDFPQMTYTRTLDPDVEIALNVTFPFATEGVIDDEPVANHSPI